MPNSINKIQTNASSKYDLTAVYSLYATCETGAGTGAKVAKLIDASITSLVGVDSTTKAPLTGMHLFVKFTATNTIDNPTLSLNTNGNTQLLAAKSLMRYGTTKVGTSVAYSWYANAIVEFIYDGTNWVMVNVVDAMPISGGTFTGSVNAPDLTVGDLLVNGDANFTNTLKSHNKPVLVGGSNASSAVTVNVSTTPITPVTKKTVVTGATAATSSISGGVLILTNGSVSTGDSVTTGTAVNVVTGVTSATAAAQVFTGVTQ